MKVYTVHERVFSGDAQGAGTSTQALSAIPADRIDRAEQLVFVGDSFSWLAAELPPVMLVAHRLWGGLAIYAAALALILALLWSVGANANWIVLAIAALHTIFGFEFNELRRSSLDADGWANLGTVTGQTREDCERRFLDNWLPRQPLITSQNPVASQRETLPAAAPQISPARTKRAFALPWLKR